MKSVDNRVHLSTQGMFDFEEVILNVERSLPFNLDGMVDISFEEHIEKITATADFGFMLDLPFVELFDEDEILQEEVG